MNIDHVHFYVEDAEHWRDWFVEKLGLQLISSQATADRLTVTLTQHHITVRLSSPRSPFSSVADYLRRHPAGVADLAFQVASIEPIVQRAMATGSKLLLPIQVVPTQTGYQKIACIQGWGDLQHTLIQPLDPVPNQIQEIESVGESNIFTIDHVVLNVEQGDMLKAIAWYEQVFGLQRRQSFTIQTEHSALCSQVLTHSDGSVQLPINEPASAGSQVQEFLDWNRGAGIQHIALRTDDIVSVVDRLRRRGIKFLAVPDTYYQQLRQRPNCPLSPSELQSVAQQEVLVDWQCDHPGAPLLQTFTQPIFAQPTCFFELIERRHYELNHRIQVAEGFGEGNFQALFEAIEREQIRRGSLKLE